MSVYSILSVLTPISVVVLAGWFFGRYQRLETSSLANLLLYITSPCLIFASLIKAPLDRDQVALMGGSAVWVIAGMGLLMLIIYRYLPGRDRRSYFIPVVFMNTANVGLPLVFLAYSQAGLSLALIFHAVNALLIYSVGIALLIGQGRAAWGALKIPYIYVVAAAILFNQLGWAMPAPLLQGISLTGDLTIPLMLIMLGYQLSRTRVSNLGLPLFLSVLRIGGGLTLALIFVQVFRVTGLVRSVIILMSALPAPISAHFLSEKYRVNEQTAAATVFVSTVLAILVFPLIAFLL